MSNIVLKKQIHNGNKPVNIIILDKLYKWWMPLSQGNIIIIYQDNHYKLVKSSMKTNKAKMLDVVEKWKKYDMDKNIKAIIWSSMSVDVIQLFVEYLIKKSTKKQLDELIKMKNLPDYLLENYKKYFIKNTFISKKDYFFKHL